MFETYRLIWGLLDRGDRYRLVVVLLLSMMMAVFEVLGIAVILPFLAVLARPAVIDTSPLLIGFAQTFGLQDHREVFVALGMAVFLVIVVGVLVRAAVTYIQFRFSLNRSYTIAERLLRGYLAQDYVWFLSRHSSDLSQSLLSQVGMMIRECLLPGILLVSNLFVASLIVTFLFLVQPQVAIGAAALLLGGYGVIYLTLRSKLSLVGQLSEKAARARFRVVQEMSGGLKELKLMGLEEDSVKRFRAPSRELARYQTLSQLMGRLPRFALEALVYGGFVALVLGMIVVQGEQITDMMPVLGLIGLAGLKLFPIVQQIFQQLNMIRLSGHVVRKLCDLIAEVSGPRVPEADGPPLRLHREIELRDVGFRYPAAERPTFEGLSARLPANSTIGIVGGTGAGKTTAVDLILGLLHPDTGEILIDGTPLTRGRIRAWQKNLGYVPQQIFLLADSVAANIAFGVKPSEIDRAAVERAARTANLHDFVMTDLPQGYDTQVGERGVRLSGGQRQRIGIARALYHDPDVLVLDEATSALDNLTERAVMEAVHNLGHQKTVIMIAHRLTTVEECDLILMLEQGRLVAQGTYEELVAGSDSFRRMANR